MSLELWLINLKQNIDQKVQSKPTELTQSNFSTKLEQVITYHKNGSIRSKYTTLNGEIHGKYESWYDDGRKCIERMYVNGKHDYGFEDWYKSFTYYYNELLHN